MPEWVITSNLSLHFNTEEDASIFYTSYLPEHGKVPKKRSQVSVQQKEKVIEFSIDAKDITAYRATINSILQFGNVVYKIVEKVDSLK